MARRGVLAAALIVSIGCNEGAGDEPAADASSTGNEAASSSGADDTPHTTGTDDPDPDSEPEPDGPVEPDAITITHAFGPIGMHPYGDDDSNCASWTLDNEQPLYVNSALLSNEGGFHHSNWFVVPEAEYAGADGYWPCDERGFNEIDAAQKGTVLFAQSTQSYVEEQRLSEGAVIKIPAHSRIVVGLHTLNLAPRVALSGLWLTLELLHPADVTGIVTPLSIQYKDLRIPANRESRFTADCDLSIPYFASAFEPLSLRVHYILPHYHYLGNYFDVTVKGGLMDGMSLYELEGFNAEANGLTFDPPLDLPGATGLSVTCGYDNWRSEDVFWGNGDGEMCVMMALVESERVIGASVEFGTQIVDVQDGVQMHEGTCLGIAVPKTPGQDPPTNDEIAGDLYLPPLAPGDEDIPPVPECYNATPDASAEQPATLSSLRETVFTPACTFSACHGTSAVAGLDLSTNVHDALMNHLLQNDPGMPLVTPGNPDRSWLYQLVSKCEPTRDNGIPANHMPLNAPILLDDVLVAKLRAWIEAGAKND